MHILGAMSTLTLSTAELENAPRGKVALVSDAPAADKRPSEQRTGSRVVGENCYCLLALREAYGQVPTLRSHS